MIVTVTATDKQGRPVRDLTSGEFTLFEDGKPQPIHTFALESYKTIMELNPKGENPHTPQSKTNNHLGGL